MSIVSVRIGGYEAECRRLVAYLAAGYETSPPTISRSDDGRTVHLYVVVTVPEKGEEE